MAKAVKAVSKTAKVNKAEEAPNTDTKVAVAADAKAEAKPAPAKKVTAKKAVAKKPATAAAKPAAARKPAAAKPAATKPAAPATSTSSALKIDIGISTADRAAVVNELSKVLADSYTVYLMTHNFHWNVTGPMFKTLHELFMTQYTELWQALDDIAERIRALGHYAPGTYAEFQKLSSITQPTSVPDATTMIELLVKGNEALARTARTAFDRADSADDQPTADLLTQRLDVHEKNAWMLRSLLQ
ncbi:putative DNA-binding protein [Alcaligenes faecalis subsp. faecalis NCIB 8687]|jgi:starvation-inducible DNA-binding protein|nr:putative DNA-binding protein [Alcaligenes faecalis subsp. faecalis NCIB 8687]